MNKLGNFEWFKIKKKIIANTSINAKLHVTLLDSCSILDSMWNSDHRTSHHTQKSLDPGTLLGAHRMAESSTPYIASNIDPTMGELISFIECGENIENGLE